MGLKNIFKFISKALIVYIVKDLTTRKEKNAIKRLRQNLIQRQIFRLSAKRTFSQPLRERNESVQQAKSKGR